VVDGGRVDRRDPADRSPGSVVVIPFAVAAVVKIAILVVATVVFLAVYGFLLDRLERRGP
jgi:hypothetical protein